jgi:hypothetical protein
MEKVIREGQIAVLYSPEYGAGWYTWNTEYPDMMFDPTVVNYVLEGKVDQIKAYATLKWPDAYIGGLDDLRIQWLPEGTAFRIQEHDGFESVEIKEEVNWQIA